MPQLIVPNFSTILPDFLFYLREYFENVDCKLELSPNVSISPYNLNVTHLGQQIYIVPHIVPIQEAARLLISGKIITTVNDFHVVTDEKQSQILHLTVQSFKASNLDELAVIIRKVLRDFFEIKLGANWEMLCIESLSSSSKVSTCLLRNSKIEDSKNKFNVDNNNELTNKKCTQNKILLLLAPISRRIVAGTSKSSSNTNKNPISTINEADEKLKKKKVIKKILKQPSSSSNSSITTVLSEVMANGKSNDFDHFINRTAVETESVVKKNDKIINSNRFVSDNRGSIQKMNGVDTKQQKTKTNSGGIVGKMTAIFNSSRSRRNSRDDSLTNSSSANNENEYLKNSMSKSFNEKIECNNDLFNNNGKLKNGNSTLSNISLYDYDKPTSVSEFLARHSVSITQPLEIKKETPETSLTLTNGTLTDDDTSYCSAISNSLINTSPNNLAHLSSTPISVKMKHETTKSLSLSNSQLSNELLNGFYEKNDLLKSTHDTNNNSELLNLNDNKNNSVIITLPLPKKNNNSVDNKLTKQNEKEKISSFNIIHKKSTNTFENNSNSINDSAINRILKEKQNKDETNNDLHLNGDSKSNILFNESASINSVLSISDASILPSPINNNNASDTKLLNKPRIESTLNNLPPIPLPKPVLSMPRLNSTSNDSKCERAFSPIFSSRSNSENSYLKDNEKKTNKDENETLFFSLKSETIPNGCNERRNSNKDDYFEALGDTSLSKDYSISSTTFESNRQTQLPNINDENKTNDLTVKNNLLSMQAHLSKIKLNSNLDNLNDSFKEMVRGMDQMPVSVLQQVLSHFSYNELCDLRRVHPHWDELCGQMLNSGYYQLIYAADRLLTDCQRRVHAEKYLAKPIQVLTNLQVYVLNPVDALRAAIDEGVICFPYGLILDKAFELLDRIEFVISKNDNVDDALLNWELLAEYSRQAQIHYRKIVEVEAERRMAEVYKFSAAQRLQRIDSFLVEASVNKLEKENEKAKDDTRWEIEQLKVQNQQLKKDNRELKQTCLKLDSRIETLERKFKTMARLLQ